MSWIWQNLLTSGLVVILALLVWRLSHREYWRLAAREIKTRKGAMVCAVILACYAVIALLDSIGWTRPLRDQD